MEDGKYQHYQKVVSDFLKNDEQKVLIIHGDWGSGKTHFWNYVVSSDAYFQGSWWQKYSCTSLFGLSSLGEVKKAVARDKRFFFSLKAFFGYLRESEGSWLGKIFNVLKFLWCMVVFGSSWLLRYVESYPPFNIAGFIANDLNFRSVKGSLVCLDDLERRGDELDVKTVFGLVDYLKSRMGCKAVIISNISNDNDEEVFRSSFEKIVDVEVEFALSVDEYLDKIFYNNLDDDERSAFGECFEALGLKNIRVVERIFSHYQKFSKAIDRDCSPFLRNSLIVSLSVHCWIKYSDDSPPLEFVDDKYHLFRLPGDKEKLTSQEKVGSKVFIK